MANRLRSLSLKNRIVLLVVVIFVASIWGLAIRVTAVLHADLEKLLSAQLSATVGYVAADLDRDIQLHLDALERIAAIVTPELMADPVKLNRTLDELTEANVLFPAGCFVANARGIITAAYPKDTATLGDSVKDRDYFREIIASGKPVVGAPSSPPGNQDRAAVPLAVPLHDRAGATQGALVGLVLLSDSELLGQLKQSKIGQTGYFIVVSPEDRLIISAPEPSRIMQRLPPRGAIPQLDRRLDEGFEGAGITATAPGIEQLGVGRKMATTGWMVLGGVPTQEIFEPIARLKRQVYLAALLISLAVAVILRFVLVRQLAPLKQAGGAMRRMTEGEQPLAAIPIARADEVGELIANFNRLATERLRLDEMLRGEIAERRQAEDALATALKRLQALSERVTKAQEEERSRIAFELHEQWGQELATLGLHLKVLEAHCRGAEAQGRLRDARAIMTLVLDQVRNMSLDLHPPQLDDFGLYVALRAHCRRQALAAGWEMHFDAPESGDRPHRDVELACFRVVQEALTNVAQHARAAGVWVSLRRSGDELELSLRDNGVGFDAAGMRERVSGRGLGLMAMEERIRQLGGRLEIKSTPGSGTEVHAVLPAVRAG
ncbi:MAG: HAMP domain-containing protein [Betaproteobacteria bacterium]|nr:HAMP domain-containing protein [Betaproteobacteria bacterium]